MIHALGGETEFLKEIELAQKQKKIHKSVAYKLRQATKETCKSPLLTCDSYIITELDDKIKNIVY